MKIKTNIRAGSGQKRNSSGTETPSPAPVYVPPVSRCVGI